MELESDAVIEQRSFDLDDEETERHVRSCPLLPEISPRPASAKAGKANHLKTSARAASAKGDRKQTMPAWMLSKQEEKSKPGLSEDTKKMLVFDPEPVDALSQLAQREKPILVPVTGKTKRTQDGARGEEKDKPRFSAISLNNSRRGFRHKLQSELASSLVKMSSIHSQLRFKADEREQTLARLCREMGDLLALAGESDSSPMIGVDTQVLERRAQVVAQNEDIFAKVKATLAEGQELRRSLTRMQDQALTNRVLLKKREESVEKLLVEKNDMMKLRAQLEDLLKRTRSRQAAQLQAYLYEKETLSHRLEERKIELQLVREKAAMEDKLEQGLKKWDDDLQDGEPVAIAPKSPIRNPELAESVETWIKFDATQDARVLHAEFAVLKLPESHQLKVSSCSSPQPSAPAPSIRSAPVQRNLDKNALLAMKNSMRAVLGVINDPQVILHALGMAIDKQFGGNASAVRLEQRLLELSNYSTHLTARLGILKALRVIDPTSDLPFASTNTLELAKALETKLASVLGKLRNKNGGRDAECAQERSLEMHVEAATSQEEQDKQCAISAQSAPELVDEGKEGKDPLSTPEAFRSSRTQQDSVQLGLLADEGHSLEVPAVLDEEPVSEAPSDSRNNSVDEPSPADETQGSLEHSHEAPPVCDESISEIPEGPNPEQSPEGQVSERGEEVAETDSGYGERFQPQEEESHSFEEGQDRSHFAPNAERGEQNIYVGSVGSESGLENLTREAPAPTYVEPDSSTANADMAPSEENHIDIDSENFVEPEPESACVVDHVESAGKLIRQMSILVADTALESAMSNTEKKTVVSVAQLFNISY